MTEISTIRMPADFEREFPGASRSASEVAVNLARAQLALVTEIERPAREAHGLSASAFQALAILDGAGEPLPGHVIAGRLLVSSASMTSLVDTLERRGLVERHPHPTDRRKVLIHLTAERRSGWSISSCPPSTRSSPRRSAPWPRTTASTRSPRSPRSGPG